MLHRLFRVDDAGLAWLAAVVLFPLLCVTAVLAIFGGMWVSGNYC